VLRLYFSAFGRKIKGDGAIKGGGLIDSHVSVAAGDRAPDSEPVVKFKPRSFAAGLKFILNGREAFTKRGEPEWQNRVFYRNSSA